MLKYYGIISIKMNTPMQNILLMENRNDGKDFFS